ncbi:MAG TPA: hypothetical protein VM124_03040 [Candidatus Limnocylindrales bacterium]|nr:hypothetical protein [Candidatus Limnocylindrales bacterium]
MSDSDLKEKEETSVDDLEKEHGADFTSDEKDRLNALSSQVADNDEIPYREEDGKKPKRRLNLSRNQKIIGGAAGGTIITVVIGFMLMLPLKINNLVENLQTRFFGTSQSAVERRTERLFSDYIKKKVLPGLGPNCPKTKVSKSCALVDGSSGKLANLYNGWRDANLEGRLAEKYGIEFELKGNTTYIMKIDKIETDITKLKTGEVVELRDIDGVGRSEVRAKWMAAIENEARFTRVLYRFKVGRLLERKYGVKRCMFACERRDGFANWKGNEARAAKVMLAERVLTPRSDYLGLLFECVIAGGCDANDTNGKDGEKRDKFQKRLDEKIAQYGRSFGSKQAGEEAIEKLIKESDKYLAGGFRKYLVEKVFKEASAKSINQAADKALPVIGWINTVANLTVQAKSLGSKYRRWVYMTNATAMVGLYMMDRSLADETKSGDVDVALLGSAINMLGADASDNHKGQPAEVSPLYGNLFGEDPNPQSAISDWVNPVASAQSTDDPELTGYTCDNGKPPEAGKLICKEESLTSHNAITDFSEAFSQPPLNSLTYLAEAWHGTLGVIVNFVANLGGAALNFALEHTPGYPQAAELVGRLITPFMQAVADHLIPDPFSDMSGARRVNMDIGGADVAGNYFAHYGLGGKLITPSEQAAILDGQSEMARIRLSQRPVLARLLDTEEPRSLISQVAVALPTNLSSASMALTRLTNPLTASFKILGSVMAGKRVLAQATITNDPFGISQYGYPLNDSALTADPEQYTEEYCKNKDTDWVENAQFENPDTAVQEHTVTNPCRLESAAITSAGALFTDSVLDPSDTQFDPGQ